MFLWIKKDKGHEGILKLGKKIKYLKLLGSALSRQDINSEEEDKYYKLIEENYDQKSFFVKYYIFKKAISNESWIDELVNKMKLEKWSDMKIVKSFIAFHLNNHVWKHLDSFNNNSKIILGKIWLFWR